MRRFALAPLAFVVFALAATASTAHAWSSDEKGWEKISAGDGIVVYKKVDDGSATITIRGEALIPAKLDDIADVMKDNKTAADWMPLIVARRDLKTLTANSRLEYTHLGMPWPVTDRYFINHAQADRNADGSMRMFVRSVDEPDADYLESDKVLGFLHTSEFLLTPKDGGTFMQLEVNSDPRGMIPKFLVNMAQKKWPRDFFEGLKKQLETRGLLKKDVVAH